MQNTELVTEFNHAVNAVKACAPSSPLTDEVKLNFYKYYKQATIGDCNLPQPWAIQLEARAKWDAWNSVRGISRENAMFSYCELYIKYY